METELLLSKCITLLYRESQLENMPENSADLVRTVLEKLKISEVSLGIPTKRDIQLNLKALALDMASKDSTHSYDATELLQQIRLITRGDENLYTAIAQAIEPELSSTVLKRTITNIRKTITNFYRELRLVETVGKAHRALTFNRHSIPDLSLYVQNLITELQITSTPVSSKDPAIIRTMDIGDDTSMNETFSRVTDSNSGDLAYRFGWRELNEALQGGARPGDCLVTAALQHNYKTGSSLSMFAHIAMFNTPKTKDPTKKPLLYRVSAEDPVQNNAQFLYQLLKYEETGEAVDVRKVATEEMSQYVKQKLQVNGFHVLIDEVNPQLWTYQSLINRVITLESLGYKVEVLQIDYLAKIPTTGCVQGSLGDDIMDMLSKVKAFSSSSGILFMTPHQLSTEAKRLLQMVPAESFLSAIKGGGFFEKSRGLDRIYDIGILMHKIETPSGDYLHMMLDKHRFPTVVDSVSKSWFLPFPKNKMPIPSNLDKEDYRVLRKLPKSVARNEKEDALFQV